MVGTGGAAPHPPTNPHGGAAPFARPRSHPRHRHNHRRHSHHCGANRFFAALRQVSTSNFEVPDEATVDKVAPALEDLLQSSMDAVFGGPDGEPFDEDDD